MPAAALPVDSSVQPAVSAVAADSSPSRFNSRVLFKQAQSHYLFQRGVSAVQYVVPKTVLDNVSAYGVPALEKVSSYSTPLLDRFDERVNGALDLYSKNAAVLSHLRAQLANVNLESLRALPQQQLPPQVSAFFQNAVAAFLSLVNEGKVTQEEFIKRVRARIGGVWNDQLQQTATQFFEKAKEAYGQTVQKVQTIVHETQKQIQSRSETAVTAVQPSAQYLTQLLFNSFTSIRTRLGAHLPLAEKLEAVEKPLLAFLLNVSQQTQHRLSTLSVESARAEFSAILEKLSAFEKITALHGQWSEYQKKRWEEILLATQSAVERYLPKAEGEAAAAAAIAGATAESSEQKEKAAADTKPPTVAQLADSVRVRVSSRVSSRVRHYSERAQVLAQYGIDEVKSRYAQGVVVKLDLSSLSNDLRTLRTSLQSTSKSAVDAALERAHQRYALVESSVKAIREQMRGHLTVAIDAAQTQGKKVVALIPPQRLQEIETQFNILVEAYRALKSQSAHRITELSNSTATSVKQITDSVTHSIPQPVLNYYQHSYEFVIHRSEALIESIRQLLAAHGVISKPVALSTPTATPAAN